MKPHRTLAETVTPDGARLTLQERNRVYTIRLDGRGLMDSSAAASELLLGDLAVAATAARVRPRILLGGLGLGFTLQRVLETTGARAIVHVVELIQAVVDWNREHLLTVNGGCLRDARVRVIVDDVARVIARARPGTYDAILLDIDNGPIAMVQRENARLYAHAGIKQIIDALKPGGRVAIWSAGRADGFAKRLAGWGLSVKTIAAKSHVNALRHACTIYVADKSE